MADDQQPRDTDDGVEATVTNPDVDPENPPTPQNYAVGGPLQSPPAPDDGDAFHPQEGGTTQGGERVSAATRRFIDARDHVQNCVEEKSLRDRTGVCTECGATVSYGQTECPHAVLVLGTCANCGTNYDRAGWTNKPTELTAAAEDQGDAAAPANQEA
jgi:hypothetical protein